MGKLNALGSTWKREWAFFLIAMGVILLDQLAKLWVRANMVPGQSIPKDGILRLTYVTNTGSAFGLLPNQTYLLTLVAVVGIGIIFLYYRAQPSQSILLRASLGMQLGGAAGNLLDRLRWGHVIDFVDLRVWPIFNLADSAIVVGAVLLAWFLIFSAKGKEKHRS